MDPHFQPSNSSPSPQDPHPYPQTNSDYTPETNPDPNNYPTLPSAQNHKNPQYPQSHHAPQENSPPQPSSQQNYASQENPYVKGNPGYVSLPEYGNTQHDDQDSEKARLNGEVKELERALESYHLQCYTYYSCIMVVVAFLAFLIILYVLISSSRRIDLAISLLGCCWLIVQSYVAFASTQSRSVTQATTAWWMMIIALVPSVLGEVMAISALVHAKGSGEKAAGILFTIFSSLHLVTHIFLNIIGAFQVRKILMEREKIEMKLVENYFNNQVS